MTTALSSREKAVIVIQYLAKLPFPPGTTEDYLQIRFSRLLSFYHKRFFHEISSKTLIELCIEVRKGMEVVTSNLQLAVNTDASYDAVREKMAGEKAFNVEKELNPDALSLYDALKAENIKNLKNEGKDESQTKNV